MNPNDIWAIPPLPDKGDPEENITYASVGRALSAWELFETDLAFLFAFFIVPAHDSEAARRAYGSIVSFNGRADALKSAAATYFRNFPYKDSTAFDDLMNIASRAAPRRNEIAHGVLRPYMLKEPWPDPITYAVFPAYYATKRHDVHNYPKYAYASPEIERFKQQFDELLTPQVAEISRTLSETYVWKER
jgi:hypothetical protein